MTNVSDQGMYNIIVGSSRAKSVTSLKNNQTEVHSVAGGKIRNLTKLAKKRIKRRHPSSKTFVYFIAGLPDVTVKTNRNYYMNGEYRHYEEVTFTEEPETAASRVVNIIRQAEATIKKRNATPVFCTIIPCSLSSWNHHRLKSHCTTHLLHFNSYEHMQDRLHTTINLINQRIQEINSENNVITPRISKEVAFKRKGNWRYRYGQLCDGTHGTEKLNATLSEVLTLAIERDSEKHSHGSHHVPDVLSTSGSDFETEPKGKRSWRRY